LIHNGKKIKYIKVKRRLSIIGKFQVFIDRTGEININHQGLQMRILNCRKYYSIDVIFEDGTILYDKRYDHFKDGAIINPMYPSVYNIGYFGIGKYVARLSGSNKNTSQYQTWHSMMSRCYDKKSKIHKSYKDCSVCNEWLNYQNFAKWYDDNFYQIPNEVMCLDKDILHKGNKVYSPENCVFAPNRINVLFIKTDSKRGNFPIGVYYNKLNKNYRAQFNAINKIMLDSFDTPEKAFECYKKEKEKYIKQIADEYKNKIPNNLYKAMINYKVEILD